MNVLFILEIVAVVSIVILTVSYFLSKSRKKLKIRDRITLENIMEEKITSGNEEPTQSFTNDFEKIDVNRDYLLNQDLAPEIMSHTDKNFEEGLNLFKNKKFQESVMCFTKAIELNPAEASPYYHRGLSYSKLGMYKEAIDDFTDTMLRQLNNPDAFFQRGSAWLKIGEKENALRDFSEYIFINSTNPEVYYLKGVLEFEKENYTTAIKDFSNAIRLNPKHEGAYFKRGLAKQKNGDIAGCCEDLQTAFNNGNLEAFHYIKEFCR